jgi:hypothetical protein
MARIRPIFLAVAVGLLGLSTCDARSASGPAPLVLERTLPLAGVRGRIDHLAIDAARGRLFVAELGNGSVEAIELAAGKSLGRIAGLAEPQGVGYLPDEDELAVATGGDGMVRFYRAADLKPVGSIRLGEDADDVRVEARSGRLVVGYGQGLALIDPKSRAVLRTVALPAHPEGFEVEGDRAIVNLPGAGAVAVVDLAAGREIARWRNPGPHFNFPLAWDRQSGRVAVVYRLPARVVVFDAGSGRVLQTMVTCGDADDDIFDAARGRLYVVCGGGAVEVFQRAADGYRPAGRVETPSGARTGLFSPKLDRLYVAARAGAAGRPAAILVYRPR